jgi:hypothetical protein
LTIKNRNQSTNSYNSSQNIRTEYALTT